MQPSVVLIQQPTIDFNTLLVLSNQLLGYSLSTQVDADHRKYPDAARFISCLAAIRDPKAKAGLSPNLLNFATFTVLMAADERDLIDILEAASGMPFVQAETVSRGVFMAIVTGTLLQWRDAVKSGASPTVEHNVRWCYCRIKELFDTAGFSDIWKEFEIKTKRDNTFYLEDKRK